jgi:hypothetical protein
MGYCGRLLMSYRRRLMNDRRRKHRFTREFHRRFDGLAHFRLLNYLHGLRWRRFYWLGLWFFFGNLRRG